MGGGKLQVGHHGGSDLWVDSIRTSRRRFTHVGHCGASEEQLVPSENITPVTLWEVRIFMNMCALCSETWLRACQILDKLYFCNVLLLLPYLLLHGFFFLILYWSCFIQSLKPTINYLSVAQLSMVKDALKVCGTCFFSSCHWDAFGVFSGHLRPNSWVEEMKWWALTDIVDLVLEYRLCCCWAFFQWSLLEL
jgi:hypothetical protein